MGNFEPKERIKIYLDNDSRDRVREIKEHLEDNYQGWSDFVQSKLHEERTMSLEERIQKEKQEMEKHSENLERLQQIRSEREQQQRKKELEEELREKQEELRKVAGGSDSRKVVREQVENDLLKTKPERFTDEEYLEKKSDWIERKVDKELESSDDVDSLVEEVESLQEELAELNGGRESWFMDLSSQQEVQSA